MNISHLFFVCLFVCSLLLTQLCFERLNCSRANRFKKSNLWIRKLLLFHFHCCPLFVSSSPSSFCFWKTELQTEEKRQGDLPSTGLLKSAVKNSMWVSQEGDRGPHNWAILCRIRQQLDKNGASRIEMHDPYRKSRWWRVYPGEKSRLTSRQRTQFTNIAIFFLLIS